ncbi:hypothetical protein BDR26DRAFT_901014 [Obelidium mucronatum]|nr:hypothetical protein BDR26DRAFT_901014 [Obelidium mucronatum]
MARQPDVAADVVAVWEGLKTKARKVFPSSVSVVNQFGADFLNIPAACVKLSKHFETGGHRDMKQAFHYMKMAADLGHAEAQLRVAEWLHVGFFFDKDLEQATHYYKLAAENNISKAHNTLGNWYATGTSTLDKDVERALFHLNQGGNTAITNRYKDLPLPESLCLNSGAAHTAKHDVFISYADEFDSFWASTLQAQLNEYGISAYAFETCRHGMQVGFQQE